VILGFRGFLDLVVRRLIPWPSLFGTDDARLQEEDVVNRRRAWTWRFIFRVGIFVAAIITIVFLKQSWFDPTHHSWPSTAGTTMLAKALATGFNSPFVSIPGSGFAQAFIGIDAVIVRFLARKAKKLARKWGGQCIVFIDEIDAVGMRRQALRGGNMQPTPKD